MNSENSKFYILIVCSLVIFITSLFSISDSSSITSSVLGIVLLIIPIRKSNDNRISNVSQYLLGVMMIVFIYGVYIRNF